MHHFKPMLVVAWQYGNAIISNTDQNLQGPEMHLFARFGYRKRKKKKTRHTYTVLCNNGTKCKINTLLSQKRACFDLTV